MPKNKERLPALVLYRLVLWPSGSAGRRVRDTGRQFTVRASQRSRCNHHKSTDLKRQPRRERRHDARSIRHRTARMSHAGKRPSKQMGDDSALCSGRWLGHPKFQLKNTMTKDQAITKALEWEQLHDDAQCEEGAECFAAAESLRIEAADIEKELRDAGFDAFRLCEEQNRAGR